MRWTDKRLSDKECREILTEIVRMVIATYAQPIRNGFKSRMGQAGYDLIIILRKRDVLMPGEADMQQKLEL